MWVIKTEKGSVSSQTLSLFTPHTSQVMPEPGAGPVLAGGGVHSPVFVPAVATYWGVRTRWGQLITGCWSPRPTSLWSPMPRCDAGDTGAWSHYQMSWHQVREYWSLPRRIRRILVVTSVIFMAQNIRDIASHLQWPVACAPEIMHGADMSWFISHQTRSFSLSLPPVPSVMCSCEARVRVKRVRGDKNLDWPWGN